MSLGVPLVVSNTKIDRYYFNDSIVRFFESGNPDALAKAIVEVLQNGALRESMVANALEYAAQNSWQRRQGTYLELLDALIENRPLIPSGPNAHADISTVPAVQEMETVIEDKSVLFRISGADTREPETFGGHNAQHQECAQLNLSLSLDSVCDRVGLPTLLH